MLSVLEMGLRVVRWGSGHVHMLRVQQLLSSHKDIITSFLFRRDGVLFSLLDLCCLPIVAFSTQDFFFGGDFSISPSGANSTIFFIISASVSTATILQRWDLKPLTLQKCLVQSLLGLVRQFSGQKQKRLESILSCVLPHRTQKVVICFPSECGRSSCRRLE